MRDKGFRLQQLSKKIRKRLKIVKNWRLYDNEPHPMEEEPGRLDKNNLNCGCKMCHYYKYLGNSKCSRTRQEARMDDILEEELKNREQL